MKSNGEMTPGEHVRSITAWAADATTLKYHIGQREHGGHLWEKTGALANLEEEILDMLVYFKTAKDQLRTLAREGKTAEEAFRYLYKESP